MKTYAEKLKETAKQRHSLVCFGMDPVLERMPIQESRVSTTIVAFFTKIFEAFEANHTWPSAVKPNYAYYAQYGSEGLAALEGVCKLARQAKLPIILDAKRGDIGKSSAAYAKEAFVAWQADAVTVSPYMGTDSVQPFVDLAQEMGRGLYVLTRTSNAGARDFQEVLVEGKPFYRIVAERVAAWGERTPGTVGAVIGATAPTELNELHTFFAAQKAQTPYLVPGVGSQGGSASEVLEILKKQAEHLATHRINSSSGISYAWEKEGDENFGQAAARALRELNDAIKFE